MNKITPNGDLKWNHSVSNYSCLTFLEVEYKSKLKLQYEYAR